MFSRVFFILATIASVVAWAPARQMTMTSNIQSQISKAVGVACMGFALAGPMPVLADGAVSKSTVFRARNSYGRRILDLESAAGKGDFAAFENKKAVNAFDLFISGSNALKSKATNELKATETAIEKKLYDAVKSKVLQSQTIYIILVIHSSKILNRAIFVTPCLSVGCF
jgi:hypothetical protein